MLLFPGLSALPEGKLSREISSLETRVSSPLSSQMEPGIWDAVVGFSLYRYSNGIMEGWARIFFCLPTFQS